MNKLEIAKLAVSTIAGVGVSRIAGGIIQNQIVPKNSLDKAVITTGRVVIGMMISDATKKFVDSQVEEYQETFRNMKAEQENK